MPAMAAAACGVLYDRSRKPGWRRKCLSPAAEAICACTGMPALGAPSQRISWWPSAHLKPPAILAEANRR